MARTSRLGGFLCIGLVAGLAGCSVGIGTLAANYSQKIEPIKLEVAAGEKLVVDSDGGSITVLPGDAGVMVLEAEKRASSEATLDKIKIVIDQKDRRVRVSWNSEDGSKSRRYVIFAIKVPKGTPVEALTKSGSIDVHGNDSGLVAETKGGAIEVEKVAGDLKLITGGGSIDVAGARGQVVASSGGGSIDVAGEITGKSSIKTGGGSIDVVLPDDARLTVEASTGGGSIRNDFGLAAKGAGSRSLTGQIGDGSAGSLTIKTGGGSVEIRKAK